MAIPLGCFQGSIAKGKPLLPIITDRETLFRVADAAVDFFCAHAEPGERFKFTADRVGWDRLQQTVEEAYHG